MKKVFLILGILCLFCISNTRAQKQAFDNGLYWELNNGVLTISGNGPMPDYCSPWKDKGAVKKVVIERGGTSIGTCSFWECNRPHHLLSVEISNTVTSIGELAFYECSSLNEVTINSNAIVSRLSSIFGNQVEKYILGADVTSIGDYAFSGCSGLTSLTIPSGVTSIGGGAFSGCSGLTEITIPSGVTSIGNSTFRNCSGLTEITIPNSVTNIGDEAFYNCSSLTSVTILNPKTSIGLGAFSGCSSQLSVTGSKQYNIQKSGGV